jgi:hypothetical protein
MKHRHLRALIVDVDGLNRLARESRRRQLVRACLPIAPSYRRRAALGALRLFPRCPVVLHNHTHCCPALRDVLC